MTFFKLDDQFQDHPSMIGLSMAALGLWTAGLAYCSRFLTDGEIPRKALFRICPQADAETIASELVEAGRWIETERAWVVESYLQHNTSRAHVEEIRAKRAEAGAIGGQVSGQVRAGKSDAKQARSKVLDGCFDDGKPDTDTDVEDISTSRPPSDEPPDEGFEVFWKAYPPRNGKRIGKSTALSVWRRMTRTKREVAMRGVIAYAAHCRRTDQLAKDAHRWLRDGLYEEWASEEATVASPGPTHRLANGCSINIDPGLQAQARGRSRAEW